MSLFITLLFTLFVLPPLLTLFFLAFIVLSAFPGLDSRDTIAASFDVALSCCSEVFDFDDSVVFESLFDDLGSADKDSEDAATVSSTAVAAEETLDSGSATELFDELVVAAELVDVGSGSTKDDLHLLFLATLWEESSSFDNHLKKETYCFPLGV